MSIEAADPSKVLREGQELFFAEPPNHRGAAERFERVVTLSPTWAEGHHWLGSAFEALGDEDRAARAWQTAHTLDPNDSRCLISLGVLRTRQRRFNDAIQLLEQGIALKPHYGFADAKLFLAEALEGANRMEQAKQQWREVLELEPMYPSHDEPMKEARRKLQLHGGVG
ncbi:MAG: hypothetical protein DCC59_17515 [Chloroflexi bacterium]|nr:tetratricopeptide repeat protein [Acidobacteriota bacterium]RIK45977.1 MAG: hypothetical protein DCC59_17515 [Chloroflexota bacterium]